MTQEIAYTEVKDEGQKPESKLTARLVPSGGCEGNHPLSLSLSWWLLAALATPGLVHAALLPMTFFYDFQALSLFFCNDVSPWIMDSHSFVMMSVLHRVLYKSRIISLHDSSKI